MKQPEQFIAPYKGFMVAAMNLLACLTKGLGSHVESLVTSSKIMQLLFKSLDDPEPKVRQCAFALLSYLTKACFGQVSPFIRKFYHHMSSVVIVIIISCLFLAEFLPILVENIDPEIPLVCNNAICAIGELALKLGTVTFISFPTYWLNHLKFFFKGIDMHDHIPLYLNQLISIMNRPDTLKFLLESTGKTIFSHLINYKYQSWFTLEWGSNFF